eukprot:TRINITY_DN3708_c1_g1_i1.p1 TRINITY_DN3708_c1_g1~~TRINITY_DN3708_c1_g1_i1.p1  ORF type:complete len:370 (+),score=5.57 TRINITY_DN3708_c1_g1_i1:153-1112(+)
MLTQHSCLLLIRYFSIQRLIMLLIVLPYITTASQAITCEYAEPASGALDLVAIMPTTSAQNCQKVCELAVECFHYRYVENEGLCLLSQTSLGGGWGSVNHTSSGNCVVNAVATSSVNSYGSGSTAVSSASATASCTGGGSGGSTLNQPEYNKEYLGEDISESFAVRQVSDCQTVCDLVSGCGFYTFMTIKSGVRICWVMATAYNAGSYYEGKEQFGYLFENERCISGQSTGLKSSPNQQPVTEQLLNKLICLRPKYYQYVIEPMHSFGTSSLTASVQDPQAVFVSNQCYGQPSNCNHGRGNRFVKENWDRIIPLQKSGI